MNKRRSLTPETEGPPSVKPGAHAMRRGGVRQESTERVTFKRASGEVLDGWALNTSKGGLRAIVEGKVELGEELDVTMGSADDLPPKKGRIVWLQEEPDGFVVGVEVTSASGTLKAAPPQSEPPKAGDDDKST